jgi:hypothetical protein
MAFRTRRLRTLSASTSGYTSSGSLSRLYCAGTRKQGGSKQCVFGPGTQPIAIPEDKRCETTARTCHPRRGVIIATHIFPQLTVQPRQFSLFRFLLHCLYVLCRPGALVGKLDIRHLALGSPAKRMPKQWWCQIHQGLSKPFVAEQMGPP